MKQMKKKVLMSVIAGLVSTSALAADGDATGGTTTVATVVNGGTIHFKGEVVNAACAVDAGSADQTVQLGQVRSARLSKQGETSSSVGFNIKLNDCDTSVSTKASVAFAGPTLASNDSVLSVQSDSAAGPAASNVGIQILDAKGTALKFDGATYSSAMNLTDGTNTLPFQARYYATGAATPGVANADATFKVQYQ